MVHTAVGYARMANRLQAFACTTSIGPGATNMVTGAAVATTNRIPVLLLPGDVFATRRANPVFRSSRIPASLDVSVNDCLRPVSRYFDRSGGPSSCLARCCTRCASSPTPPKPGPSRLALPEDVQTEAFDVPDDLLVAACGRFAVRPPEAGLVERLARIGARLIEASAHRRRRRRHLQRGDRRAAPLVRATGMPVAETQAGKGSLRFDHPASLGALGATGTTAANEIARGRRPRDRRRHEVERLHDGVVLRVPEPPT